MNFRLLSLVILVALFSSCVSKKKFEASVAEKNRIDLLRKQYLGEKNDLTNQVASLNSQISSLEGDTTKMGKAQRDLRSRYNNLLSESTNKTELLGKELQKANDELVQKRKMMDLYAKELKEREARVQELEGVIRRKDSLSNLLLSKVKDALINFSDEELSVSMKGGKVYVSLSEQLLFQSGSASINTKGKDAIGKLAEVLNKNEDIEVMIEGHTDDIPIKTAKFQDNWDLSVIRATSVVRILVEDNNVDAQRVVPSGRAEFFPIASNETRESRKLNRRTEIILTPKLDELFSLLEGGDK